MKIQGLNPDELIQLEGYARSAHLINTGVWPVFTALLLVAYGNLSARHQPDTGEIRLLYIFLSSGGMYVCLQWWLSVRQTARRYKRLWRTIRNLERAAVGSEPGTKSHPWPYDIFWSPKTAMWALRGESLPVLLFVIFLYLVIIEAGPKSITEVQLSVSAGTVFVLSLFGQALWERNCNIKDENAFEKMEKALEEKRAIEDGVD